MPTLLEQMETDLDIIFDTEYGLAVPATYTSKHDGVKEIKIILDIGRNEINPITGVYESVPPSATAKTVDVPNIVHKDTFLVDDVEYEVITSSPDGSGVTIIELGDK